MRVYLIQHGEAVEKNVDPERPLTERGRRDVGRVADFLARAGVTIQDVLHSGKTRARQTAELFAARVNGRTSEQSGLSPEDDIATAQMLIERATSDLAMVGHLPHLSVLAAELLQTKGKRGPVTFQRGGVVALERNDEGEWQLRWAIVPELFV